MFKIEDLRFIMLLKIFSNHERDLYTLNEKWNLEFSKNQFYYLSKKSKNLQFLFKKLEKININLSDWIKKEIKTTYDKKTINPIYIFWKNFKYEIFPFVSSYWRAINLLEEYTDSMLIYELIKFWCFNKHWKLFLENYIETIEKMLEWYLKKWYLSFNEKIEIKQLSNIKLIVLFEYLEKLVEIFTNVYQWILLENNKEKNNQLKRKLDKMYKILLVIEQENQDILYFNSDYTNFWVRFQENFK